jgi:hypothetical protein
MKYKIAATAALLLVIDAAYAHHSFAPVYDGKRMITKAGVVTAFRLVNPHAIMWLDVKDEAGDTVRWTVEFDGRVNLTGFGWTDSTITVGEHVSVTGNPTHSGSPRMFFAQLARPDGTTLRRPFADHVLGTLEEARRERAQERDQQ